MGLNLKESVAFFDHTSKINVVYNKGKSTKHVTVLTTLHNKFTLVEEEKTEAHMFYNASMGGIDTFDMMCAASSTSRKTRRWPLCAFYGLLNKCMNNAWIVYSSRPNPNDRSDFTMDLAYNLCRPWAINRYNTRGNRLTAETKNMLISTFKVTEAPPAPAPPAPAPILPNVLQF